VVEGRGRGALAIDAVALDDAMHCERLRSYLPQDDPQAVGIAARRRGRFDPHLRANIAAEECNTAL
jgi:hypothetical protein